MAGHLFAESILGYFTVEVRVIRVVYSAGRKLKKAPETLSFSSIESLYFPKIVRRLLVRRSNLKHAAD